MPITGFDMIPPMCAPSAVDLYQASAVAAHTWQYAYQQYPFPTGPYGTPMMDFTGRFLIMNFRRLFTDFSQNAFG